MYWTRSFVLQLTMFVLLLLMQFKLGIFNHVMSVFPRQTEYHQDSFDWNKPDQPQRMVNSESEFGPSQMAFHETLKARHAVIGPKIRAIAARYKNAVVIMLVNYSQLSLLFNFLCACDEKFLPCREMIFVFTLDSKSQKVVERQALHSYHYENTDLSEAPKTFGDEQYAKFVFWQIAVVYDVLHLGVDVLVQDNDIVWFSDPLPYFQKQSRAHLDMLFMSDGDSTTEQPIYANAGFIFNRNSERTRKFWTDAFLNGHREKKQQLIMKPLLIHHYFTRNLRLFILPDIFANGHRFRGAGRLSTATLTVAHMSWTTNLTQKIERFRKIRQWHEECVNHRL
eukprot:gene20756-24875_t